MFKKLGYISIVCYQKIFSPDQGFFARAGILKQRNICIFYPSCSEYAKISIEKYGFLRGIIKSAKRITRCHPWQKNHIDLP
ncbi:MAG: membrane protein insertion efficiency factor YidD [bacterium]|nr:membrane protein insertion efficiency factor YidD [bacterium]